MDDNTVIMYSLTKDEIVMVMCQDVPQYLSDGYIFCDMESANLYEMYIWSIGGGDAHVRP